VLTDRYVDSSLAYQGAGRDLGQDEVRRLSQWATGDLRPDLVVLLDVDPVVGLQRAGDAPDRIEAESLDFHRRVRASFLHLAEDDPERYLVVAADQSPEAVLAAVRARLEPCLPVPAKVPVP
jgi:dTMP kinase